VLNPSIMVNARIGTKGTRPGPLFAGIKQANVSNALALLCVSGFLIEAPELINLLTWYVPCRRQQMCLHQNTAVTSFDAD